jgi:hypothetical protein
MRADASTRAIPPARPAVQDEERMALRAEGTVRSAARSAARREGAAGPLDVATPAAPPVEPGGNGGATEPPPWGDLPAPWEPLPDFLYPSAASPGTPTGFYAPPSDSGLGGNGSGGDGGDGGGGSSVQAAATTRAVEDDEQSQGGEGAGQDIDALARKVYDVLRRRLLNDRRRGA